MKFSFLLILVLSSTSAFSINIQQFTRSHSLVYEIIEDSRLEDSHVYHDYDLLFNLGYSYVDSPLTVKVPDNSQQIDEIVKGLSSIHFGASWYLRRYLQLSFQTSFSQFTDINDQKHTGFGDIDLRLKLRLMHTKKHALSIMPNVFIPTKGGEINLIDSIGTNFGRDSVLSDRGFGYGAKLIYERMFKHFQIALNLGLLLNKDALFVANPPNQQFKIDYTKRIQMGFGLFVPIRENWGINLEWIKQFSNPFFNDDINPNEVFLGTSLGVNKQLTGFTGVSLGNIFDPQDGNGFRVVAGIKYTPRRGRISSVEKLPSKPMYLLSRPRICTPQYILGKSNAFTLLYSVNSFYISKRKRQVLAKIARRIVAKRGYIKAIKIHGHTSTTGSARYNQLLGERRANALSQFFVDHGVPARLIAERISKGETTLLSQSTRQRKENLKINRRVEVLIEMTDEYKRICF